MLLQLEKVNYLRSRSVFTSQLRPFLFHEKLAICWIQLQILCMTFQSKIRYNICMFYFVMPKKKTFTSAAWSILVAKVERSLLASWCIAFFSPCACFWVLYAAYLARPNHNFFSQQAFSLLLETHFQKWNLLLKLQNLNQAPRNWQSDIW